MIASLTRRAALLAGALLAALPAVAQEFRKFTVAGWSQPISEVTHLLAEPDKGFFKARGIALDYLPGNGGGAAIQNLLSGQADIAFTDPASFFQALDKGEKLIAVYNIYPQNVFNVVSLKSSGIRTPVDLKGKRVGVYSLSSATRQQLQLLLRGVGLSEDDIRMEVTGLLNFTPLIQGQVDATAASDTALMVARERGLGEVEIIEIRDHLNLPSDIFVVREQDFAGRKALIADFLAAYRDAAAWMIARPEEAAKLAVTRAINGRDEAVNLAVIRLRNAASVSQTTDRRGLGRFDLDVLRKSAEMFQALGMIKARPDIDKVFSEELLPK